MTIDLRAFPAEVNNKNLARELRDLADIVEADNIQLGLFNCHYTLKSEYKAGNNIIGIHNFNASCFNKVLTISALSFIDAHVKGAGKYIQELISLIVKDKYTEY